MSPYCFILRRASGGMGFRVNSSNGLQFPHLKQFRIFQNNASRCVPRKKASKSPPKALKIHDNIHTPFQKTLNFTKNCLYKLYSNHICQEKNLVYKLGVIVYGRYRL